MGAAVQVPGVAPPLSLRDHLLLRRGPSPALGVVDPFQARVVELRGFTDGVERVARVVRARSPHHGSVVFGKEPVHQVLIDVLDRHRSMAPSPAELIANSPGLLGISDTTSHGISV